MTTYFVMIGNSDDRLTQREWANFCRDVDLRVEEYANQILGVWFSDPSSPYQNMCWSFDCYDLSAAELKQLLGDMAKEYRQDSIAWVEGAGTEFLRSE